MIRVVVVEHGAGDLGMAPGRALRDAGHEVIHAGPQDRPDRVVAWVVQEDADVLVIVLPAEDTSAGAAEFSDEVRALLDHAGADDVLVLATRGAAGVADQVAAALEAQPRDVRD